MKRSAAGKGNVFLKFAVIAFCIYLVVVSVQLMFQIREKRQELNDKNKLITLQEQENMELSRFLTEGNDEDYIENYAREKLGLARPEERVYRNIGG